MADLSETTFTCSFPLSSRAIRRSILALIALFSWMICCNCAPWSGTCATAAGCEAGFVRLNTPDDADDAVRKAFYIAKMESRPVMLSAPMDIQQKAFEDDDEAYQPSSTLSRSHHAR